MEVTVWLVSHRKVALLAPIKPLFAILLTVLSIILSHRLALLKADTFELLVFNILSKTAIER